MPERLLQLDDLRRLESPEGIASLFRKLGYNAQAESVDVSDLQLSAKNTEAIYDVHLIANQGESDLQVLLFQLHDEQWISASTASSRLKAIASQLGRRATEFLLLATKDYNQLMLVNPRKTFDEKMNVKASIRKLLIDRTNPTAYDRDRLEAIAVRGQTPQELYKTQCEAFDVDKLTKSFYRGYKELFDRVQALVKEWNAHPYFEESDRLHQFSQRLLGRVMFLYFLQKKEFLVGDRQFLTTQYRQLETEPDETDYYAEVLEPLFFETLNKERPNFESRWGGKIPYLNGGLFDRDYGEGIKDPAGRETPDAIVLPNSLFDPGESSSILGFFNSYNFTISENVADDEDVAVDPEMLGKVFENMLAAEERGQSGTFYTPRGIVNFMCAEVLSRYLADESGMDLETIRHFIEYDPDLPDAEFNKLMTPQQARTLKRALETIKVLDPAVGSGAFPLGMMQTILAVRQAIARREGMLVQRGSLTISQWKRDIIANNLYGVDIKPGAIEIAKLRMWLSLVVDIPDIDDVEPLPNLDYKLMCGNSLISTIYGEQLIPDPTKEQQLALAVTPIQQAIQPLLDLQQRYFSAQSEERQQLRQQILEVEANVFRVAVQGRRNAILNEMQLTGKPTGKKYKGLAEKAQKAQAKKWQELEAKLAQLDKFAAEVESGERSLNFFHYHLHFRDVFEDKGGFDVVIGNPPYLGQDGNKEIFEPIKRDSLGKYYKRNMDLFYFFFHLALNLCRQAGYVSFITTNYYLTADGALLLRKDLKDRSSILKIINFNNLKIFDSARGQHNIINVLKKQSSEDSCVDIMSTKRAGCLNNENLYKIINYFDKDTDYCTKSQNQLYEGKKNYIRLTGRSNFIARVGQIEEVGFEEKILNKIIGSCNKNSFLLGDITDVNQGILTGANEVSKAHIQQGLTNADLLGHGIYVLNTSELMALNLSEQEKEVIKPFFKNSDIKRYFSCINPSKFLVYSTRDLDIEHNSNIYKHFLRFERIINSRTRDRGEIKTALKLGKWWVIFAARDRKIFEGCKIICPYRAETNSFAFNDTEWYAASDVYFITEKDQDKDFHLKYLLALLNSSLYYFWLYHKGKRKGDTLELFYTPLREIPIKKITYLEQRPFIDLVDKILHVTSGSSDYLVNDKKQAEVKEYEQIINQKVFELYAIEPQEIHLINQSLKI